MTVSERLRAFLAVEIDTGLEQAIANMQQELKPRIKGIRWTRPGNIHLTVKFLGDIPHQKVNQIGEQLYDPIGLLPNFHLDINRAGVFPSFKQPRILWLGCKNTPQEYYDLLETVERNMVTLGFAGEKKKSIPHLTIGRIKNLQNRELLSTIVNQYENSAFPRLMVNRVVLFQSILKPAGAVYKVLKTFNLRLNGG